MIDQMGKLFGIPWHGLWKRQASYPQTETFVSPSGATIFPPEPLQAAGGCSWKIETGAPAVDLTPGELAVENAAGRTWLNYGMAYGTPNNIRIGNRTLTGPLYRDDNGDFWMLALTSGNLTFTRFGLFNNAPTTVTQSISTPAGMISQFHNFAPNCRKFAFVKSTAPTGFTVYSISGVPPSAALTFEAQYLANTPVAITYTGGPQSWHVMAVSYVSDPHGVVQDEFFGDIGSAAYSTWASSYSNFVQGPIGSSVVTHKTLSKPLAVMFGDDGSTKPVIAEWTQSISRVWCSAWTFTHYPTSADVALLGNCTISDSGTYQLKIGGVAVLTAPWSASATNTYQPYLYADQTLSILGDSYHDAWTVSTWNGTSYNPDPTQANFYSIAAVDTPIAFPDQTTPALEKMLFRNGGFGAFALTNMVAAINAGRSTGAINHWRFCSRDAELPASFDIINMPQSAPFMCTMHPVTHQFERDADVTNLVFI